MIKFIKIFCCLVISLIILSIVLTGCNVQVSDNNNQQWDYKPMIAKENNVYGDTGITNENLPQGFVFLGTIDNKVSQTEPMIKGTSYYISNTLPIDTKIYGNNSRDDLIYAEYNDIFIQYELMD